MDEGISRLTGVNLYWIPLGAGDHIVRVSGKLYEAFKGISERRPRAALYHSASEITLPGDRFHHRVGAYLGSPRTRTGCRSGRPVGGRAPGWNAGLIVAARQAGQSPA